MARNRMLNPDFWLDEELAKVSAYARLLYQGLWGICDDNNATLPNRPEWIKAQVFPYESVNTPQLLSELSEIGKIVLFKDNDKDYWYIKNFFKYQRVEKPSKEKYPAFNEANIINSRRVVGEKSGNTPAKEKLSKDKIRESISSLNYLKGLPEKDQEEFSRIYECTKSQVLIKAEQLYNYCLGHGKKYSNYRAMLQNALLRDFGKRLVVVTQIIKPFPEQTPQEKARSEKKLAEIRARFHPERHKIK